MRKCVGVRENRKKYLDDCTAGLMKECKLPKKMHDAENHLKSITIEMEKEDEEDEEIDEKRKDEERKDDEDEKEKEKIEEDKQKEEKIDEGQDDNKGEKEYGKDEEEKKKQGEKEKERKDSNDDEERDHNADNEYNDMNKKNQTKHRTGQVSCHHEVEMNKKLDGISRKLNFGQDVNFGERDYEVVCTLLSIVDNFDSLFSTTPIKCAKQINEKRDHIEEKKTIPKQEKAGPQQKKLVRPEVECEGI
ncbi:hypothetical protein CDL12_25944 [Handroanthus impetiginosus]|uniref:Uncharacterized protein n=1 Tax=Handroanthus impetiginosus TaxID=429701 RepID=A0A2G9G8C8_9LAMI|nr:hypothetical protein CDL12_25944 [Handroanthus impetiginosus]